MIFIAIYTDPHTILNPFPPPTPISAMKGPSLIASPQPLPEIWTSTPEQEMLEATEQVKEVTTSSTPVIIITNNPEDGVNKEWVFPQTEGDALAVGGFLDDIDLGPGGGIIVTAPVGVFTSTWQKMQSIPSFSWKEPDSFLPIKNYRVYFGTKPDGQAFAKSLKTHYSHPAIPSGEYYFRVEGLDSYGEVLDTSRIFVFRYDDTPPTEPTGFGTANQGDAAAPYFAWSPSSDAHSGMIGGLSGYAIYQGPAPVCGKPVAFTSVAHWTPVTPLISGATEYFCVKAYDAVGNGSKWVGPIVYTNSR